MKVGEFCNREVIVIDQDTSVLEAATLMRLHHVGDLVIVDRQGEENIPTAIVTDRDIVIETIAEGITDLDKLAASDLAMGELVTISEEASISDAVERMKAHVIRRMPVVNARGGLVGILTFDDLIDLLVEQLSALSTISIRQQRKEFELRP